MATGIAIGQIVRAGPEGFTYLADKWIPILTASLIMSVAQSVFCYAMSCTSGKLLALGGNTGSFVHDVGYPFLHEFILTTLSSSSVENSTLQLVHLILRLSVGVDQTGDILLNNTQMNLDQVWHSGGSLIFPSLADNTRHSAV